MQIHIRISGRVQGVGFRAWTVRQALNLNLVGFVRNRRDGTVEVFAEGRAEDIEIFLKNCHQGPIFARVNVIQPIPYPDAPMPSLQAEFMAQPTV